MSQKPAICAAACVSKKGQVKRDRAASNLFGAHDPVSMLPVTQCALIDPGAERRVPRLLPARDVRICAVVIAPLRSVFATASVNHRALVNALIDLMRFLELLGRSQYRLPLASKLPRSC